MAGVEGLLISPKKVEMGPVDRARTPMSFGLDELPGLVGKAGILELHELQCLVGKAGWRVKVPCRFGAPVRDTHGHSCRCGIVHPV